MHKLLLWLIASCSCACLHASQAATTPNIYAYTQANMLSTIAKGALPRVYVPNENSGTVSIIDPMTYQVISTIKTGKSPQHVVPAYDMQTLWVLNNKSNSVTPIDPNTGLAGTMIPVTDPYNLYFSPDGKYAVVVCEARKQLELRDPKTMQLHAIIPVKCRGANHLEYTADNRYAIVTCEFSSQLMKIDMSTYQVISYLSLLPIYINQATHTAIHQGSNLKLVLKPMRAMPQDVRSTADGRFFFVADMMQDGVHVIDPVRFTKIGFIKTGIGAHSIYPSRDGKVFYVANRGCHQTHCKPGGPGSVSVLDPVQLKVVATWPIPNGGSPDMGNVSSDGKTLWLSGRYDNEVYVFDTTTGQLLRRIPVGKRPHGLAIWPQPGRYSLGHTGNMR